MSIRDQDFCLFCSMPDSCCDCEFSDSTWSSSTSQASCRCTSDGSNFDAGDLAFRTTNGGDFLGESFGIGDAVPCAASTPNLKNSNSNVDGHVDKWESPGAMPPPESSSPLGLEISSLPLPIDRVLPIPRYDAIKGHGGLLPVVCRACDVGQLCVKAPVDDRVFVMGSMDGDSRSPTPTFRTQGLACLFTDMDAHTPMNTLENTSTNSDYNAAQGHSDERLYAVRERRVAEDSVPQDICTETTRTTIEQTNDTQKPDEIDPGLLTLHNSTFCSGPTILEISTQLEYTSSLSTEDDSCYDATRTSAETIGYDDLPLKPLSRAVSIAVSCLAQATLDNPLKRRRSSVDPSKESKKAKLDRTASQVSCTSKSSAEIKYQAAEPASMRRARSLRSEVSISACSEASTDSLFYPSPLSSPRIRACSDEDEDDVQTLPGTPLPTSVDYARSRANPLLRTVAVFRRRCAHAAAIPLVPIIAPPGSASGFPVSVRCAEDDAIDRLQALLRRERGERERDGLHVHDERREERLRAALGCVANLAACSRGSTSSSGSSVSGETGWWEEESEGGCSPGASQETRSVVVFPKPDRFINRETWCNTFGIANDLRIEVTEWILQVRPKEPVPCGRRGEERRLGADLYDQLTNSRQTRFHAAQLFHRYFLLPDKVQFWREVCGESCGSGGSGWEKGIWDLAVACIALSVKLHRDCLPPLGPVYADEFLDMAPHSMTHNTFEASIEHRSLLAQRDVMYTFQFFLASCTPQDVLDELWMALPTLRRATAPMRDGWAAVQYVTWDKLFEALLEPDMMQYPVTLLTAAALVDGLVISLARHYKADAEGGICSCKAPSARTPDDESTSWQIYLFEAAQLVDDVVLDVRDVLGLSDMELDECRTWLSYVGRGC